MKRPTSKLLKKNALAAKKLAEVPAPEDGVPIGDSPEKLKTNSLAAHLPVKEADTEFTVSPLRELLADRGRTIRHNEHIPNAKTRQGVMYGAGLGLSHEAVAKIIGVSVSTLRSHYADELDVSRDVMMNDIQTNLYNIARDAKHKGTVQAGIFLLSRLGGEMYREKKALELSGPDGQPLQIDHKTRTIDPTLLTPEQRDALREIVSSAMKLAQQPAPLQIEGEYKDVSDGE